MSKLLIIEKNFATKYEPYQSRSNVLKSRENISKLKCNKSLKKKLKKYKLRKNGEEDPDVIDVSKTLISSLRIKSPNNQHCCSHEVSEENRPHNYLSKMVRLKKTVSVMEATPSIIQKCNSEIKDVSISLSSKGDQDKKQTDVFKLLMESRNKSIGSNSPGKEKCEDESVEQKRAEHKELRAKRILSLNRMAQAKGSLKKLEIEEHRQENIKRKMEKRAKRLKSMIVDTGAKHKKKDQIKCSIDKLVEKSDCSIMSGDIEHKDIVDIKTPVPKTFDLFKDMKVNLNSSVKKITKEDEDFLKKLSPSIRKKENMLCYFQKVNKESNILQDDGDTGSQNGDPNIIKVKVKSKNKVTEKKTKHITGKITKLPAHHEHDPSIMIQELQSNIQNSYRTSKKRKCIDINELGDEEITNNTINNTKLDDNDNRPNDNRLNDSRPKRNAKKPIKYADDFQFISSDEEFHIFTPKKKRKEKLGDESTFKQMVNNTKEDIKKESCKIMEKVIKTPQKRNRNMKKKPLKNENHSNVPRKVTKLAPIFVPKPLLDSATIEAKQKFLQSGVPHQLKKTSTHQTNMLPSNEFHKVVHIQSLNFLDTSIINYISNIIQTNYAEDITFNEEMTSFKKLLEVPVLENYCIPKFQDNIDKILQYIKKIYPKFPVYRTYHLLRGKSKGEFKDCIYPDLDNSVEIFNNVNHDINIVHPDKLNWVDKYKPTTEKQVLGNFESIRELKRWLVTWTENDAKSKRNRCGSDSSDFCQSDTDSRETMKNENNLLIITGKVGTGKTLSVYAVAAELAIKVIEVNASTKRTGKIMLQDLQEATQSHKVDRAKNNIECSQQSQELCIKNNVSIVKKKRGRKKKVKVDLVEKFEKNVLLKDSPELTVSQDNGRTGMSLILIDDADIVFDQDDGFCYAISQLIQSSKRPVILVTASLSCSHLQKFSCMAKVIKMRPFLPRMLGTWLDIMCLVDINMCSPGLGAKTLDHFNGDIRRTINYLQFYTTSHKYLNDKDNLAVFQDEEVLKVNVDDENSCSSWRDKEGWGDKYIGTSNHKDIDNFESKESQLLHSSYPKDIFCLWWNLPNLLNYSVAYYGHTNENLVKVDKSKESKNLNKISAVLDNLSMTDYLGTLNEDPNIISLPWLSFEGDSVLDNENFATYSKNIDCINEISWELIIKGVAEAQSVIDHENKIELKYPNMSIQRERDRVVSRHKTLTNCLNPSIALDRRALALDYWPSCRSICRTEKSKTNNSSKRNNRFCHYLKSLNIVCRNEYFDNLGDSLSFEK